MIPFNVPQEFKIPLLQSIKILHLLYSFYVPLCRPLEYAYRGCRITRPTLAAPFSGAFWKGKNNVSEDLLVSVSVFSCNLPCS
jgi:hypothetical protein